MNHFDPKDLFAKQQMSEYLGTTKKARLTQYLLEMLLLLVVPWLENYAVNVGLLDGRHL
jgi:hypothetical protein